MNEIDSIITSFITTFIYSVLAMSCFKYFSLMNRNDTEQKALQEQHKKRELQALKEEIEYIQNDFNEKFADAVKGNYKRDK